VYTKPLFSLFRLVTKKTSKWSQNDSERAPFSTKNREKVASEILLFFLIVFSRLFDRKVIQKEVQKAPKITKKAPPEGLWIQGVPLQVAGVPQGSQKLSKKTKKTRKLQKF
jgi:hypothetical protein